jgi:hypothetical protein
MFLPFSPAIHVLAADIAADGSEIVFDRVQINSGPALIERTR